MHVHASSHKRVGPPLSTTPSTFNYSIEKISEIELS
ncbi:hypothetical protein RDI58_027601 [Solanum bulbocastanum]|uniref:Uncharacterized protein n=1 Tax=Solanum bulbocastanum TaxID=147425 RepID=A0AAN8SVS2_SOLBU